MTFRFPMAIALAAVLATGCTGKSTDKADDTDVATDTDTDTTIVEDTDVQDTDPLVCDNATDTDTAVTCVECVGCTAPTGCETQYQACDANNDCKALFACVTACTANDNGCPDACVASHEAGSDLFQPIVDCVVPLCPNSCSDD